jgi:hypothetical protein
MSVTISAVMAMHQARRKFIELHLEFSASHVSLTAFTMMIYFNFFWN